MAGWTVQKLIEETMVVTAYCHRSACNHSRGLELIKLREKLGPDAPAMHDDLAPKLRCSKCEGKEIGLRYAKDSVKTPGMGQGLSAYAKAKGR